MGGVTELSVTATQAGLASFDDGSFGFYNYSQQSVLYSAITQVNCSVTPGAPECQTTGGGGTAGVPEPGTLILLSAGFAGLGAYRRRKSLA